MEGRLWILLILHRLMNRVSKVNHTFIFISTILVIAVSTILMRKIEPDTFPSLFDSLWWVMTTMTTVGYGDFYPTSTGGRIFAMALYIIGIGILGVVIGKIVDSFGTFKRLKGEGKLKYKGKNHIVIVGWSKKAEYAVKGILSTKDSDVVIIDELVKEPFEHDRVHFIAGDAATENTIDMANIKEAKSVIIFADDKIDNPLLVDGKSMLLAASIEQYAPNVKTVIEVIKEEHLRGFTHVKVDEFILSNELVSRRAVDSL